MARRNDEGLGRAQRRALATRVRLLEAARHLFCEKGVDFTTIADITERADLGKGTFYRHFSGKDEVMTALVEDAVTSLLTHVRNASVEPQNLQEALHQILTGTYGLLYDAAGGVHSAVPGAVVAQTGS